MNNVVSIKKFDEELQIVYGEIYAPNVPDSQGDFMTEVEIRKMAHKFMKSGRLNSIDTNHDHRENGSIVVESFIAREDDPDFIASSWVVGVHIEDPEVWSAVKSGELNGFSMEAQVHVREGQLEMSIPDKVFGVTSKSDNHEHGFEVTFDDQGQIIEGRTSTDFGHWHRIKKGTATGPAIPEGSTEADPKGHSHRFSAIEQIEGAGVGGVR